MCKKLIYLVSAFMVVGLIGPVAAQQVDMEIGFATQPPVLDGEVDEIWADASTQYFVPLDDPANASGIWKVLYDAENLYVIVDVTDDSLQNDSASSWQDDSVELYFDGGNTKVNTPLSGDDHQYTFGWTTDDIQGTNIDGATEGIEHAQVTTDTGWRIEIKLPWLSIQGAAPQAGDLIGIDCYYNDDDDGGDSRENKLLSFSAVEGWNDASQWGTAMLTAIPEPPAALPEGWQSQDIGTTGGSVAESDGTWAISADGADIWGSSDEFHYAYVPLSGDGTIIAQVVDSGTGSNGWAKGGVMIRETLDADSKHALMALTGGEGGGMGFQNRPETGGNSFSSHGDPTAAPPYWVKLTRVGNTITGYSSADGVEWVQQPDGTGGDMTTNPVEIEMAADVYIGLFATSHAAGEIRTYTFDNVSVVKPTLPNIIWVSYHGADDEPHADAAAVGFTQAPDIGYTDLLKANGYNVTRVITSGTPDVEVLNAADLVIISRTASSGHYSNDGATMWNSITSPMINLNGYTLRSSRMGYTTGTTMVDTTGDVRLTVTDPAHPIFAGIPLTDGTMDNLFAEGAVVLPTDGVTVSRGISINNDPADDDGTVLATIAEASADTGPVGGMVIAEWPAGATMENSSGSPTDVLGGPRLVFLTGSREPSGVTGGQAAALYDLFPDGEQMLLNAVNYMIPVKPVDPGNDGLVAYYAFENDANDSSGNGNDGTIIGDPNFVDGPAGYGMAMEFHGLGAPGGGGDYIDCGNDASLDITGPISLALWIRPGADDPEGQGTETAPMAKAMSGMGWSWQVRYGWGSPQPYMAFTFNSSPRAWVYVGRNLELDEWCHIACSHDGTTLKCYLNGEQTDSTPMGQITSSEAPVLIGSDGWGCDWIGAIDEVAIYNRDLSVGEVMYLAGLRTDAVNLMPNPSFEEDEPILDDPDWVSWCTWNPAEGAGSNATIVDTESIDGTRSLLVEPKGVENWHFILVNISFLADLDKNYTAGFWAKAEAPRPLTVQMKASDNSVSEWGATDFELTTEWAEYSYTSEVLHTDVKLEFLCAGTEVPFWLDLVSVYEVE